MSKIDVMLVTTLKWAMVPIGCVFLLAYGIAIQEWFGGHSIHPIRAVQFEYQHVDIAFATSTIITVMIIGMCGRTGAVCAGILYLLYRDLGGLLFGYPPVESFYQLAPPFWARTLLCYSCAWLLFLEWQQRRLDGKRATKSLFIVAPAIFAFMAFPNVVSIIDLLIVISFALITVTGSRIRYGNPQHIFAVGLVVVSSAVTCVTLIYSLSLSLIAVLICSPICLLIGLTARSHCRPISIRSTAIFGGLILISWIASEVALVLQIVDFHGQNLSRKQVVLWMFVSSLALSGELLILFGFSFSLLLGISVEDTAKTPFAFPIDARNQNAAPIENCSRE